MKIVTCEFHKIALAALVLGLLSVSPNAHAVKIGNWDIVRHPAAAPAASQVVYETAEAGKAPSPSSTVTDPGSLDLATSSVAARPASAPSLIPASPQDTDLESANSNDGQGMSLQRLRNLADHFAVRLVGDTVYMDGSIPRKCAIGASISMSSNPATDGNAGQHAIRFTPGPGCDKLSTAEANDRVKLSSRGLFGPGRSLSDLSVDGSICILHADNGPDQCDTIDGLKYISNASKAKDASAKQASVERANRKAKEEAFVTKLAVMCKQGDFAGFGQEIESAKGFLGDVTSVLSKVDGLKQKFLADQINKAKDLDGMKDAYQAYLDASEAGGWDTDEVTAKYADKRVEKMNDFVKDGSKSPSERASAIRELASDLRDMDLYDKDHKGRIGAAYMTLANSLKDSGSNDDRQKYADAERYYNEAVQFADPDQKVVIEAEIAKMWRAATDACLADAKEKGKGFNTCDALAKKEKSSMDNAITAQAHVKTDGSMEALAGMKNEKLARFGQDGYAMNVSGYGTLNRMGGSYDATKYTDYTQSQQQIMMQMMMKQQMGVQGGMPGSAGSSGYFQ